MAGACATVLIAYRIFCIFYPPVEIKKVTENNEDENEMSEKPESDKNVYVYDNDASVVEDK